MTTPPHATKELSDPLRAPTPTPRTDAAAMVRPNGTPIVLLGHWVVPKEKCEEIEQQLIASLRTLEEKNEVLLVAETALNRAAEAFEDMDRRHTAIMEGGLRCTCYDDPDGVCVSCNKSTRLSNVASQSVLMVDAALARIRAAKNNPNPVLVNPKLGSVPRSQTSGGMEGERKV